MLTNGPNLGLLMSGDAGEEHYDELMARWRGLDLLVQPVVIDRDLSSPPGSPVAGAAYIVAAGASGAWSGHAGKLARWSGSAWEFYTPKAGWRAFVQDEAVSLTYIGSAWTQPEAMLLIPPNNQAGTAYDFALADIRRVTRFTSNSAVAADVPNTSAVAFPVGCTLAARAVGDGELTIAGEAGVTINVPAGFQAKSGRKGATLMLHHVANNEWDITGDLKAA
jgi:hypothetical protein